MSSSTPTLFPAADPQTVAALRARWRRGERQAALELLQPYAAPVYQILRSLVVVEGEAVELALQVFTAAWRGASEQPPGQALLPWLLSVMVDVVRRYGRKERRGQHLEERLLLLLDSALGDRPAVLAAAYGESAERLLPRCAKAREKVGAGVVTEVAFREAPPLDLVTLAEARATSAGPPRLERRALVMPVLGAVTLAVALIWYFTARPGLDAGQAPQGLTVTALNGEVRTGRDAATSLALASRVNAADRLITGPESAARLEQPGVVVDLGAETTLELLFVGDTDLALVVLTGALSVTATGVATSVRLGESERVVELRDGRVRVSNAPEVAVDAGRAIVREGRRVLLLSAGERADFLWSNALE